MERIPPTEAKRLITISIDPDQADALDALVIDRRSNRSQIIREAIDSYLRVNGRAESPETANVA